ncbi:hypothetical protein HY439_01850 [Candidatus Microgenomates bacterium]|nr:hypothetical protein [Candidatus Microgenomates bacterium]
MQKGFAPIFILVGILVITAVVSGTYYFLKLKTPQPRICTMDVKTCLDGSSVGRAGPNCEFAPCPKSSPSPTPIDETANWKTYINKQLGFSIKGPGDIKQYDFPGNIPSYIAISLPTIPADQHQGITIMRYPNTEITIQELMEDISSQRFSNAKDPSAIFKKSYYTVDGKQEEMITRISSGNGEARFLFIQANKNILEFTIWYTTKYKQETLKLFDQILSTFKFLD